MVRGELQVLQVFGGGHVDREHVVVVGAGRQPQREELAILGVRGHNDGLRGMGNGLRALQGTPTERAWTGPPDVVGSSTIQILTFCGILTFALDVLSFAYATFVQTQKGGGGLFHFCDIFWRNSVLWSYCWLTGSKYFILFEYLFFISFIYYFLFSFFFFGVWRPFLGEGGGSVILEPLKRTWGILDSGIAVHSYTGIQMWISWTRGHRGAEQETLCRAEGTGHGGPQVGQPMHPALRTGSYSLCISRGMISQLIAGRVGRQNFGRLPAAGG